MSLLLSVGGLCISRFESYPLSDLVAEFSGSLTTFTKASKKPGIQVRELDFSFSTFEGACVQQVTSAPSYKKREFQT